MQTESRPIGANGILHILKDAQMRFDHKAKMFQDIPTSQLVITETEDIEVKCPYCDETGMRYVGTHGDHYQYGPMLYSKCPTCNGTRIKERHPFPKQIVKLAKLLAHQDQLVIARTIAGILLGMKEGK